MKTKLPFFLFILTLFSSCVGDKQTKSSADIENVKFEIDCTIRALELENDSSCWFAGSKNKFGFTNDFGKTWQISNINHDSLNLEFRSIAITDSAVFILSIGSPALLFKINKQTLAHELVYKEVHEKVFYNSMQFWDNKNGIAVGDPTESCLSILLTKDGGNTWHKLTCENLPAIEKGEAGFAASNTNISLVDKKAFIVTGGKAANILVGDEFGKNWEIFKTPIVQGETGTGIYTSDFLNEKEGIIAGGDWTAKDILKNTMALTSDSGRTWQVLEKGPGFTSCVQFIPNTKGILSCSTNGIFYSEHMGQSWKKISEEAYYGFRFSENGEHIYFSGRNKLMSMNTATLLGK